MSASHWKELPGKIQRRLEREIRSRSLNLDVALDRFGFKLAKTDNHELALSCERFAPWQDRVQLLDCLNGWEEGLRKDLLAAAEDACAHRFELLGSGFYDFGSEIDWHLDFKSGYRWNPRTHHSRIRWGGLPPGVDIKVPWELSRCMHFATLGLADLLTGESRYYEEFKKQTLDWIANNPPGRGVNWVCAMDVGMRAVNWINALMLFSHRIEKDQDIRFLTTISESLWLHGLHVRRNLEWRGPSGPSTGNHFLADLVGLLAVGAFFRSTKKGRQWWQFSRKWIETEMRRQVLDDGCNFETSTSYHRMVMEMFLWADSITCRGDDPFGDDFRIQLGRMADFVTAYSGSSGRAAQFGDNDSGRLLWAGLDNGRDHRYLTRGDCEPEGLPNRLLLRGTLGMPAGDGGTTGFTLGGYYFLQRPGAWVGLRAGKVWHGGCHAHCDQLSFVLSVAGREILVDRGTGLYTPDITKRNRYRATSSHNTLSVNGWEQNGFSYERDHVFRMPDDTAAKVTRWEPDAGIWQALHHGFARKRPGLIHEREVRMDERSITITDKLSALLPNDRVEWFFHFAPDLDVLLEKTRVLIKLPECTVKITWNIVAEAELIDGFHSPSYGAEVSAKHLKLATTGAVSPGSGIRVEWAPFLFL